MLNWFFNFFYREGAGWVTVHTATGVETSIWTTLSMGTRPPTGHTRGKHQELSILELGSTWVTTPHIWRVEGASQEAAWLGTTPWRDTRASSVRLPVVTIGLS